jgi:hypothetical protein
LMKRINKDARVVSVNSVATLDAALAALAG